MGHGGLGGYDDIGTVSGSFQSDGFTDASTPSGDEEREAGQLPETQNTEKRSVS